MVPVWVFQVILALMGALAFLGAVSENETDKRKNNTLLCVALFALALLMPVLDRAFG